MVRELHHDFLRVCNLFEAHKIGMFIYMIYIIYDIGGSFLFNFYDIYIIYICNVDMEKPMV